jgi:hypothetical protein
MRIRNLTPHAINLVSSTGETVTLQPEGMVPRVQMHSKIVDELDINGSVFPVKRAEVGAVEGLPASEEGTILVVSRIVAMGAPERTDLLFPDDFVRNEKGQVIGCKSLSRV